MRRTAVVFTATCLAILTPAGGAPFTFKATDNCHVSEHSSERGMNAGNGAARGKVKGAQEFVLVNFDLSAIRGMTVTRARLRFADAGADLLRVGVSTVAARWSGGANARFANKRWPVGPGSPSAIGHIRR